MGTELLELLGRRMEFLERLDDGPAAPRELVEDLPRSRTTVNRALRELRAKDLVERVDGGYETTPAGALVLRAHRRYERAATAAHDAADVLAPLEAADGLDPDLVADATVSMAGAAAYDRFCDAVDDRGIRGWLAAPDEALLGTLADRPAESSISLVLAPTVADSLARRGNTDLETLAERPETTLLVGETPGFSLVTGPDGAPTTAVVHDDGAVHGTMALDAADWADARVDERLSAATRVDEVLAAHLSDGHDVAGVLLREAAPDAFDEDPALPDPLARQGFERLTDDVLAGEPKPPAAAFRSGFTPVEVSSGYAIERQFDSEDDPASGEGAESLADALAARLEGGDDCALVGPPGTGKSTTCMRVAVAWRAADRGPVLYRSGEAGGSVSDPDLLAAYLRAVEGHALVVVEDAPRQEADAVFEALADCRDRDDVSFLLDAREGEWRDRLPIEGVDRLPEVTMPALERSAAERMVDRVEGLTDVSVEADVDALLDALGDSEEGHEGPEPGGMYLLKHWLTLRADERPATATPDSALVKDVERVQEVAAEAGSPAVDLAVLVNLCNLAGLAVRRELAYALAFDLADGDLLDGQDPVGAVEDALDALAGHSVFDVGRPGTAIRFATRHETWSTAFLAALPDREGEATARERVARVVSAVATLADDPSRRERIDDALDGHGAHLRRIAERPGAWADDIVEALFEVPTDRGQLAPLYGHTGESDVDLPDACSAETRLQVAADRGRAYGQLGDESAARREHEWLLDNVADAPVDEATRTRFRAEAERRLAAQARDRGDLDRAEDLLDRSLQGYSEVDDAVGRGKVARNLGIVCAMRGDYDAAAEHFEDALETHRAAGNRTGLANAYNDRGLLAKRRGDVDVAADCLSAARDLTAELGDTRREAVATMNLGTIALERNDHETARRRLVEALGLMREAGYERGVESVLTNLGDAALGMLDLDTAEDYLERALAKSRDLDDADGQIAALRHLSDVARHRGRFDAADEYVDAARDVLAEDRGDVTRRRAAVAMARGDHERAADLFADLDEEFPGQVACRRAELARRQGDLDVAETHVERCLDHYGSGDEPGDHARALATRARIAMDRGDLAEAADALSAAGERTTPASAEHVADVVVATATGRLRTRQGDHEGAVDLLEPVATTCRDAGAVLLGLHAIDPLVDALVALDRVDAAVEWCTVAAEMAGDAGLDAEQRRFRGALDDIAA